MELVLRDVLMLAIVFAGILRLRDLDRDGSATGVEMHLVRAGLSVFQVAAGVFVVLVIYHLVVAA